MKETSNTKVKNKKHTATTCKHRLKINKKIDIILKLFPNNGNFMILYKN